VRLPARDRLVAAGAARGLAGRDAKRAGASVLILTRSATPYDELADARLGGALGETLPALAGAVLGGDA
jgi:hypothetical protein